MPRLDELPAGSVFQTPAGVRAVRSCISDGGLFICLRIEDGRRQYFDADLEVIPLEVVDPGKEGDFPRRLALLFLQGDDDAWPALLDHLAETGRLDVEVGKLRVALYRLVAYLRQHYRYGPSTMKALVDAALPVLGDTSDLEDKERGGAP